MKIGIVLETKELETNRNFKSLLDGTWYYFFIL